MIRQPRYRGHYGRTAVEIADEALRLLRYRQGRLAVFVYADGEAQVCDGGGERFVRRCAVFGQELVGVYALGATRQQIIDDAQASTYGDRLEAAAGPRRRAA